ncbi:MAG TPA: hypothetical protein VIJ75_06595 [Hanamia sp.]
MPDNIDAHLKSLHSKLQLLLKKHALLVEENGKYQSRKKELNEEKEQLQMQVAILKTSAVKLEGKEKSDF